MESDPMSKISEDLLVLTPWLRAAQFAEGDADDTGDGEGGEGDDTVDSALVERAEGDLTDLTTEELTQLETDLRAEYEACRPNVETDADVEALERIANAITAVVDRGTAIEAEAAAREERLSNLDAAVGVAGEGEGGEGTEGSEGTDLEAAAANANGEAANGANGTEGTEAPAPAAGEEARTTAGAGRSAALPSLSGLRRSRPASSAPVPGGEAGGQNADPLARLTASKELAGAGPGIGAGTGTTRDAFGKALKRMAAALVVRTPTETPHYVGTIPMLHGEGSRIVADSSFAADDSDGPIDAAVARLKEMRDADNRLVASGGTCAPPEPDYTITLVGDLGTDMVQHLPTVGGDRPLLYFPWYEVDMNTANNRRAPFGFPNGDNTKTKPDPFSATGHVTAAQDAAGYVSSDPSGPTADKGFLHITCGTSVTLDLEATFAGTTVGQFQKRAFPEFVDMFEKYVRIGFDNRRDELAQAKILNHASAKIVNGNAAFGLSIDLLGRLRLLAASIRSVRRSRNMDLDVWIPEWAADALAQDIAQTLFGLEGGLKTTRAQALAVLAVLENLHIFTYRASWGTTTDGSLTGTLPKQAAGAANDWPTQIRVVVYPTGGVFQKTGWEISLGLNEVGVGTNDVSAFMELAENTGVRTSDIYVVDQDVCVSGARGGSLTIDCATGDD